jgi:uncharacterized membrane protein
MKLAATTTSIVDEKESRFHEEGTMSEKTVNASRGTTMPLALDALLFLALVALTAANYGSLPDKIPVHFNFSGTPDGWSDKGLGAWMIPIVAVVMNLIFGGSMWVVRNKPAWVNVPRKAEFMALSADARAPINDMVARFVLWMAVLVEVLLIYIQAGMVAVALGAWKTLPVWPSFAIIGGFVVYISIMYVRISRAIRRANAAPISTPS